MIVAVPGCFIIIVRFSSCACYHGPTAGFWKLLFFLRLWIGNVSDVCHTGKKGNVSCLTDCDPISFLIPHVKWVLLWSGCFLLAVLFEFLCVVSVIVKAPLSFDNEHLRRSWSAKARLIHSNIAGRPLLAPLAALNYQGRSLFCHIRLACRNLMRRAIPNGWFCIGV